MPKLKKTMAAVLLGSGLLLGYMMWPAKGVQNRKMTAELHPIRHDTFADHLHRKITNVARLKEHHPRPVIFDNDADIDDAMALILIGNDPSISLQAITINGTGMAHARPGAKNMAAIARLLGQVHVPIAFGRDKPLSAAGVSFPAEMREKRDHLLVPTTLSVDKSLAISENGVALMHEVISTSREKVTILATGPLTNIAELLQKHPDIKSNIAKIVVMGGAVRVPGNIKVLKAKSKNKISEWNFYADPVAVKAVFASGVPITLVALDATSQVPLTKHFFESLAVEDQPDLKLANDLIKAEANNENLYLWDALAAMVMLDPSVAEVETMPLSVNAHDGSLTVAVKAGKNTANIDVVTHINHPDFVLNNYVAMVKSNHVFAARKFYNAVARNTSNPIG